MTIERLNFDQMYPDVLGAITRNNRFTMNALQFAVGIFPSQAYINQPVEVVLILQNLVDQNMQVKVSLHLPADDRQGKLVVLDTPKPVITVGLQGGEVGVLHIPVIAYPPTLPGADMPIHVAARYRTPRLGRYVRPVAGGAPPSMLQISPFKLQVLRDIEFVARPWNDSTDIITTYFDIMPKRLPPPKEELNWRYETLWTPRRMAEENKLALSQVKAAQQIVVRLANNPDLYEYLQAITDERFATVGMPLHPGEVKAIARALVYLVKTTPKRYKTGSLEKNRWFRTLCYALAHEPDVPTWNDRSIITYYLYEILVHDAILLSFDVVQPHLQESLGSQSEQLDYADRVLGWFGGEGEPDLAYVYLPLVLAGVVLARQVDYSVENPWRMVGELRQSFQGRARLVSEEAIPVFNMLDKLIYRTEQELRIARVKKPAI